MVVTRYICYPPKYFILMNNNSKKIISLNLEKNNSSLSEDEKIKAIAKHFRSIMEILNLG